MTLRKRRVILVLCVLAFLVVVPMVLLYSNGFRFDSSFHLVKTGGIYVSSPISGSQIFVNNNLKKTTNILQSGLFLQNLKPGRYSVLIAKEEHWPWAKELEVKEQSVAEARALMLPKDPEGKIIKSKEIFPSEIEKYNEIMAELQEIKKLSATTTPIERYTGNKKQKVWWNPQENKVWAEWLGDKNSIPYYFNKKETELVLGSLYLVRNVDFLPGRRDVIVIAVQNGVFAIEIDGRGGRTLQPIYKGKEPIFTLYKNDSSVYILDEETLMEIKLE